MNNESFWDWLLVIYLALLCHSLVLVDSLGGLPFVFSRKGAKEAKAQRIVVLLLGVVFLCVFA